MFIGCIGSKGKTILCAFLPAAVCPGCDNGLEIRSNRAADSTFAVVIAVAGSRDVCQILCSLVSLAVKFKGRCIGGHAFFCAGGRGLFCRCYSCLRSFLVGCIVFAGKGYGAGLSVLRPAPLRFAIAVTGGRNVCHILRIRVGLTIKFNGSCISGYAFFRTGGGRFYLRCNGYLRSFLVGCIGFAGKGYGAGLSILRPAPLRFAIAVTGGRNHSAFLSNLSLAVGVEIFSADFADKVFLVSCCGAGGGFRGHLFQLVLHGKGGGDRHGRILGTANSDGFAVCTLGQSGLGLHREGSRFACGQLGLGEGPHLKTVGGSRLV